MHFFSLWINIKRCIQVILEADLLDVQIILHMFQLFREDDHAVGAFEKVAEILHQGSGKIHDQLRAATQPKTVDQVQAVQKEMRLDLQGQVLKFGVSLVQLLFVDLQLQVVDLPDHIVKGFRQLCKFIMSIRDRQMAVEISLFDSLHCFDDSKHRRNHLSPGDDQH